MAGFQTPVKKTLLDKVCTPSKNDMINIPASPYLKRLGYGTGITVYQFNRSPRADIIRSPWALKIINTNKTKNTTFGKRLRDEANLLKKMDHPNIVGFRAFTKTKLGDCLAMETCTISLGDLIEQRAEEIQQAFAADKMMRVGLHISKALDYLHVRVLLLHADIKSHNVLIVGDFKVCKLCDFGVSLPLTRGGDLDVERAGDNSEYVGTMCWCAPETLKDPPIVTSKADIFSFGLVIWEMIALEIPHTAIDLDETVCEDEELLDKTMKENSNTFGTRPAIPYRMFGDKVDEYNYPLEVFYCCTEEQPSDRPTAHHLNVSIFEMIHSEK